MADALTLPASDNVRLLIVDDREENLYAFAQILRSESYQLDLARSGQDAFRFLLKHRYACLLCDVQMPEISGYELVSTLRQDPQHRETPVMFITAYGSSDAQVQKAFALGAVDFVTKPVDPVVLRTKLSVFAALERRKSELQAQRDLFQGVTQSLQEGVIVLESDGTASYTNPMLGRLWGEQFDEDKASDVLRSTDLYDAFSKVPLDEETHPFLLALRSEEVLEREVFVHTAGSAEGAYWSISALPVVRQDAPGTRMVIVLRDITDQKKAELEIQRKNRDLEQYAYAASHDLKAPLRHITSFGTILADELKDLPSPAAKDALAYILRAAKDMRVLVDGLLALSTVGAQALERQPLALAHLLRDVWEQQLRGADPIDAELVIQKNLPTVWADAGALRQVAANLLSNSIKFRRQGQTLRIDVRGERLPTISRVIFTDNGIGIRPEHAERIFQVFQRLHTKEEYEGSGIGLALCKKIMELHGGSIGVQSQSGTGASFVLELPAHRATASNENQSG